MLTYGSVCTGISAATVAWRDLGMKPLWFSEIEAWPCKLLKHHYPHVPNLGDMRNLAQAVRSGLIEAPDVLEGGTPCQAFSIAGLRGGMDDPRGRLTLSFVGLANAIDERRPGRECDIVWENVPGVLSDKSNAFGCFLAGLAGEDGELFPPGKRWPNAGVVHGPQRTIAWRILDAQYFGVAQRRRRVFLVASARKGSDPVSILFESEGVRRDSPPIRQAGQEVTGTLASRTSAGGFPGSDESCSGFVRAVALRGRDGGATAELGDDCGFTLRASSGGGDKPHVLHAEVCPTLRAGGNSTGGDRPPGTDVDTANSLVVCLTGDVTHTLKAEGFDASGDGTGRGTPIVAFSSKDHGADATNDMAPTLRTMGHSGSHANGGGQLAVAFHVDAMSDQMRFDPHTSSLTCSQKAGVFHQWRVRRLTPRECERLQSFPDDYTLIPGAKDGPRYKALGNSMCVYNMHWIGKQLMLTRSSVLANIK